MEIQALQPQLIGIILGYSSTKLIISLIASLVKTAGLVAKVAIAFYFLEKFNESAPGSIWQDIKNVVGRKLFFVDLKNAVFAISAKVQEIDLDHLYSLLIDEVKNESRVILWGLIGGALALFI